MKNESIDFSILMASSVHDMKNSLGMIVQTIDTLTQRQSGNTEEERLLSILHYESLRVNNDLIRLLGIYRMEENSLPLCVDEHFLLSLLEEQLTKISHLLPPQNTTIHIECDEQLSWHFDYDLISSVINNILVNTVRYTKDRIMLSARVENNQLLISVEDNGTGFPIEMTVSQETQAKSIDFNTGSTGLGLYFAAKIANLHQYKGASGSIHVENGGSLGGGIFNLSIP
ncbi:MAG: hypothetical protein COA99_12240 [Moraxellaceae bacterium]|nr:MAG: hypothetical protein COA99_12240 [Moraxellaceae bacterium]